MARSAYLIGALLCLLGGCSKCDGGAPQQAVSEKRQTITAAQRLRATMEAMPYLNSNPEDRDRGRKGITRHLPALAQQGINLYAAVGDSKAYLMDMAGKVLHRWSSKAGIWTDQDLPVGQKMWGPDGWFHVAMSPQGDLYAITYSNKLIKLDWDSNLQWIAAEQVHHDVRLLENGDVLALGLARKDITRPSGRVSPILDNEILLISPQGKTKKRISLYQMFMKNNLASAALAIKLSFAFLLLDRRLNPVEAWLANRAQDNLEKREVEKLFDVCWAAVTRDWSRVDNKYKLSKEIKKAVEVQALLFTPLDIFHTNSIEVIPRDEEGHWKKGDLLISIRNLNLVMVVDGSNWKIRGGWGPGNLDMQHHASLLPNSKIVVFDNGVSRKQSRIIQVDPKTRKIVWTYEGSPPESFFTNHLGGVTPLKNGNFLVAESNNGRVFEITRDKQIVWEFFGPDLYVPFGRKKPQRRPIYRMERFSAASIAPLLARKQPTSP